MGNCPKCKTGTLRPITTNSSNWVCGVCGHSEYRSNSASSAVHSTIRTNRANMNNAVSDFHSTSRSGSGGKPAGSSKSSWKGTLLVIIIILLILYFNGGLDWLLE